MSITAKELARQLGISAASVSFALNGRPGVSAETRARVLDAAHALGFDFSSLRAGDAQASQTVGFVYFNRRCIFKTAFFDQMAQGAEEELARSGHAMLGIEVSASRDIPAQIASLSQRGLAGILLLATEMTATDLMPFAALDMPIVLLDSCIPCGLDRVQINNHEGARIAVNYLFARYGATPGLLACENILGNFRDRYDGYYLAIRKNGASTRRSIIHELGAYVDDAKQDMLALIDAGAPIARSYFACYDGLALGAMEAFRERGYRIPEDVAFIGFDNVERASRVEPGLTTINVPSAYMGALGARRLVEVLEEDEHHPVTIEVGVSLLLRDSA